MISPYQGILGEQAPAWNVDAWFNLPGRQTKLELSDLAGKVVYLYPFNLSHCLEGAPTRIFRVWTSSQPQYLTLVLEKP